MTMTASLIKNTCHTLLLGSLLASGLSHAASSMYIDNNGLVGIGTKTPAENLEISANGPNFRMTNTGAADISWDFRINPKTGRFAITDDRVNKKRNPFKMGTGAANNLVLIGIADANTVNINGNLVVTGTITPDYVFTPEYQLESIEEHARKMWEKRHLPSVLPARTDENGNGLIDVGARSQGLLEELEKAHIYIEQVHKSVKQVTDENQQQKNVIAALEKQLLTLESRLQALEQK